MRKMNAILVIIFLLSILGINGKALGTDLSEQDTLRFKLLPSIRHNIQIIAGDIDKFIYFVDDVEIKKADYPEQGLSFFLNADMVLKEVLVNGKDIYLKKYTLVEADRFEPYIRLQAYTEMKWKCVLYELLYDDVKNLPDTVSIKIKYLASLADSLTVIKAHKGVITILGNTFWYPRNLNQNEKLTLSIKTTDQVKVKLNDTDIPFKQKDYLRTSDFMLTDSMVSPLDITFMKE